MTTTAGRLNEHCFCVHADLAALRTEVAALLRASGIAGDSAAGTADSHRHLFAGVPLFIDASHVARIGEVVAALHRVMAMPAWQAARLAGAPAVARHAAGNAGDFLGVDFHVGDAGPSLIEVNTNPGGALLNVLLGRALQACCDEVARAFTDAAHFDAAEAAVVDMFRQEWRDAGGTGAGPGCIGIVDEAPVRQYLYPEFLLFQRLFARHGIDATIVDASALQHRAGGLYAGARRLDVVYNRLTDFMLASPAAAALRAAWLAGHVVLTPHPRAHALAADKRALVTLSDPAALAALGVDAATRELLAATVPETRLVTAADADALWQQRRGYFFKPVAGFGSRGAYRGDKLTRRVFAAITGGDYVAQVLVPPGERVPAVDGAPLKVDVRAYAHAGRVLLLAARLYQGQTTNFRSDGGGFAPVLAVPAGTDCAQEAGAPCAN